MLCLIKQSLKLFLFTATFTACESLTYSSKSEHSISFQIEEYRNRFPHSAIKVFNENTLHDLSIDTPVFLKHFPILEQLALKIYQDSSYVRDFEDETTKVLYSIQKEQGHQGILIAGGDDDWVNRVFYYSYDLKGKLIDKLTLFESGGDGGYSSYSTGRFINDSIYIRKSIYCEPVDDRNEVTCDTITLKFCIHDNGQIESLSNFQNKIK